jgi:hypothetical protein
VKLARSAKLQIAPKFDVLNLMKARPQITLADHSAKTTIFWQLASGAICLILGGSIIYSLTLLANEIPIYWPEGDRHSFVVTAMASSLSLVFLVGYVIKKQFEESLTANDLFCFSIRYAFFTALYVALLYLLLIVLGVLFGVWGGWLVVGADLLFVLTTIMTFGVAIGIVQVSRLKLEGFDHVKHEALTSNESDVQACRAGLLPYRSRVRAFWRVTFLVLLGLFLAAAARAGVNDKDPALFFISVGTGGVVAYFALKLIGFLSNPRLIEIERIVYEKTSSTFRGGTAYYLIIQGKKHPTNFQTWNGIILAGCRKNTF